MVWTKLYVGDALEVMKTLESESIDMVITSPPYWGHRDYGIEAQIGLEASVGEYIQKIMTYFHELKRILKTTGSFYLNMGDTYSKKNLLMIPTRVALALQEDGWILRNDIIWFKPNHMPSSVKDRLTNTYEHLFHFVKTGKYYYDLDAIRVPHKTGPAQFNYRVREAKKGNLEIVGVKSSHEEMEKYDSRGQKVRGLKTKGKVYDGQEQHHGRDVNYHPDGKNPGDVQLYNSKFAYRSQAQRLGQNLAYARKVLGKDHETALNHPLGKNPGDVLSVSNTGINNKEPYKENNPHRLRLKGNQNCTHVLGKNPGDVFCQEQHPKYVGVLRQGKRLPPQKDRPQAFHELGKNPGDMVEASVKDTRRHHGSGPPNLRHGETILSNPEGKNPGDVMPPWKQELARTDRPLKPPKGVSFGGGNIRLKQFSKKWRLENQQSSAPEQDRLSIYHPLGRNPGDVIETGNLKYKGQANIRQDQNLGGNVGLAEFRETCRASGLPEGHPAGRNPGDVVNISPETRSKEKLLKERRRELNEMRAEGKIHWELHPSKDPRWFGNSGKNPTDFWTLTTRGFPGAHFAVYPETLCLRPILSSCPAQVCVKCGKPRERIIKTHNPGGILGKPGQPQVVKGKVYLLPDGTRSKGGSVFYSGKTVGWASCNCNAGFEPGVVLDPFLGSGTTMKVAIELGRNAIGIELNPKYVEIIKKRVPNVGVVKLV